MAVFVQPTETGDGTVYEVFRRTQSPRDQTIEVVDSREQAIAVAGRVAEPGESIEEFPQQGDFEFIARGPGAQEETPEPETSDTGGGFFDFVDGAIQFFEDPDRGDSNDDGGGAGGGLVGGGSDPMADIAAFEDEMFGDESKE